MQKIAKTRGVKGAASWCALAAILYLFAELVFQALASFLMGLRVPGATLEDPAGYAHTTVMVIRLAIGAASVAAPVIWLLKTTRLTVQDLSLTRPVPWSPLFILPVFLGAANVSNILAGLLVRLTGKAGASTVLPAGGVDLLLAFITLCALPAVGEELLFRGALQGLMRPCGSMAAITAPAVLFALLHLDMGQFITALSCGLFLGWLVERTGSLLPGILLHFVNNALAFLDIYLQLYAPRPLAIGAETVILLGTPILAAWLLWRVAKTGTFHPFAGLRPGVAATAIFQSPAYVVAAAFLAVYTVYLTIMG